MLALALVVAWLVVVATGVSAPGRRRGPAQKVGREVAAESGEPV